MRKSLIKFAPLALAVCTGAVFADDSDGVQLYGILDVGIANVQHTYNFDPSFPVSQSPIPQDSRLKSATGMISGGLSQSRWGLKGQEHLGSGLKAIFKLESAVNVPTGNTSNAAAGVANNSGCMAPFNPNNPHPGTTTCTGSLDSAISGQLFSRGAFAGISSDSWGTVTAGRNTSFFLDNMAITDPLGEAQDFSPLGYSGSYGGGGETDDSRVDNSIKYSIPVGDFTFGALYKFGGVAGSTTGQTAYQLDAVYLHGPLSVMGGFESFKDAFTDFGIGQGSGGTLFPNGTGTPGTLGVTAVNTKAFLLSAEYDFGKTSVHGGYEREELSNPSNPGSDHIASLFGYPVGSVNTNPFGGATKLQNVLWIGANQHITSAFTLSAAVYHINVPAYGNGVGGAAAGNVNYYTLLADYRFTRLTDLYAGIMKDSASGGQAVVTYPWASAAPSYSNRIVAIGMRHAF